MSITTLLPADAFDQLTDEQLAALISDLQAMQTSRQATAQQTRLGEHETDLEEAG